MAIAHIRDLGIKKSKGGLFSSFSSFPSFAEATDFELACILNLYYNDLITWEDIGWKVGDTRLIHLDEMQAPPSNSSVVTWIEQDITIVIVDHEHTDLATPINGHTKACITVQTREILSGSDADVEGWAFINGNKGYNMTFTKWSNLYIRTYLNSTILEAFSSSFKTMIKPSVHYRHTNYNTTEAELVTDTLFLPSTAELNTLVNPTVPTEGSAFEYYKNDNNRMKCVNNNGNPGGMHNWWTGTPSSVYNSSTGYNWHFVGTMGDIDYIYNYALGLVPAWAM